MSFWNTVKQGATLLDQHFVQPIVHVGAAVLHEVTESTHQLVHAVEQPIQNIVRDTKQIVGGLHRVVRGVTHLVPYGVGGWLIWTAFDMYFPSEKRALDNSLSRAAKRMRLT